MPADNTPHTLSEDELLLRISVPKFYQELVDSHTATLVEQGDPEALTAWKEIREQKDQSFSQLTQEEKQDIYVKHNEMSFEMQSIQFGAAVARYAVEHDIPFDRERIDPLGVALGYQELRKEQQEGILLPPAKEPGLTIEDGEIPKEDMRHTVAKEIEESKRSHREQTEPTQNSFGEMPNAARQEFLSEQKQASQEVVKAQQVSQDQTQKQVIEPLTQER